ncbi:MAG: chromosomal replication initiator protein DnaA [Bacteroidales bacterium]|nr:chromosomal replication initiator protein DnaA [Bacteroidales bacterium]
MSLTVNALWEKCAAIIRDNVQEEQYAHLFEPIQPLKYENNCLWIRVPSHFYVEQLESRYSDLIGKTLNRVTGSPTKLMYQVSIDDTSVTVSSNREAIGSQPNVPGREPGLSFFRPALPGLDPQLSPSLHFGNFVAGESNRLARTAGISISTNPGKTIFNPLFIHGKSGVGKTHLLHAIGNATLENNPQARVLYISSHMFQVQYSQAYLQNKINDFIHFYQSLDVLLIDDIHELSGRTGTQNVFFHIFNQLQQTGKQIVFTCDRAPKDLEGVEERLLTRFKWGLTAEMKQPDYQLRVDILKNKIQHDGVEGIPQEVIEYIARHAKDNVRDLEGIITSLMAHSIIEGRNIDMDLCRQVVESSIAVKEEEKLSVESIEQQVCDYYHIDKELIHSRSKKQEVAQARQIAMYLAKKHTDCSLAHIGNVLGKRNHATVIYACKAVEDWMETDKNLRQDIQKIEAQLAN